MRSMKPTLEESNNCIPRLYIFKSVQSSFFILLAQLCVKEDIDIL